VTYTNDIFPSGWVLLQGLQTRQGGDYEARLYYDLGDGFTDDRFFAIPASGKGVINELLYLPAGIKRVRFSPLGAMEEFESAALTFAKVGTWERRWRMACRIIAMLFLHPGRKRKRINLTFFRMLIDLQGTYNNAGKLRAHAAAPRYSIWLAQFEAFAARDYQKIKKHLARMSGQPKISLWVSWSANAATDLAATIASVCAQLYPHWTLCLAAPKECDPAAREALVGFVQNDARIRVEFIDGRQGATVMTTPDFAEKPQAEYVGILGAGDLLPEHALYCIAAEMDKHPGAKLLYSDEDWLDAAGQRFAPNFKPDWNPQLLLSQNYLGGLTVFRADLVGEAGDLHRCLSGKDNMYDLALRAAEAAKPEQIRHLPLVLYHRRANPGEPMPGQRSIPNMLLDAGRQSLAAHFERMGIEGKIYPVPMAGGYRIRYALPSQTALVSIIIPTRDGLGLLQRCLESILGLTTYPYYEIIVVDNHSSDPETLAYLESLEQEHGMKILRFPQPFNYSAINNFAVRRARGTVLCLLNNDTEIITPEWLEEMLGLLSQKGVGVVGAKLLYPNGTIQHGGDLVGVGGVANHAHAFLPREDPGYQGRALLAQDVSAVTGACLLVWKEVYDELGGLDEKHLPVAFSDVDFCLRVREAGYRIVWTPHAELYHHESVSRGKDNPGQASGTRRAAAYMRRHWKQALEHDPFYNPNLSRERPDFSLSNAPMAERPWLT
jgi:GT2 family glycosyltransferase